MFKKITAAVLSVAFAVSFAACANPAAEKQIATSEDSFLFAAYGTPYHTNVGDPPYGLQADQNTEENWKNIADCGFNYAIPVCDTSHEEILCTLERAEKAGIKVLVMDILPGGITSFIKNGAGKSYGEISAQIKASEENLIKRYDEYKTYSSFAGVNAVDEPSAAQYKAIAAVQDWWREHYPEYECYTNLLPNYASYSQLFGADAASGNTYASYVDSFVRTTNPDYLSYDHYCYIRQGMTGTIRPSWLSDLEVFAKASQKYNIPFYIYVLTSQHWSFAKPESYRDFAWQTYTAMTYGAKGIQTFLYWPWLIPENNSDNLGNGLVDPVGNIQPLWYAVREVIEEVRSFEDLFMAFDWEGTMPVGVSGGGAYALLTDPLDKPDGIDFVEATGDALIGQFADKNGNKAYMVTNYESPFKNNGNVVKLKFANAEKVLVCKKGKRFIYNLQNNTLELNMGSGEGYFVVPVV